MSVDLGEQCRADDGVALRSNTERLAGRHGRAKQNGHRGEAAQQNRADDGER
jgi:hypothetical protein